MEIMDSASLGELKKVELIKIAKESSIKYTGKSKEDLVDLIIKSKEKNRNQTINYTKLILSDKDKKELNDICKELQIPCKGKKKEDLIKLILKKKSERDKEKLKNAVEDFRTLIGATNPAEAAEGTIRNMFAESISQNAIHGSDSDENAAIEGAFHFSGREMF